MNTGILHARRRLLLSAGAGLLLAVRPHARAATAPRGIEIAMAGTPTGSAVWFRPRGLRLKESRPRGRREVPRHDAI